MRIAQASAAMNSSAAPNPASSAAQVNQGVSGTSGPPDGSAGSRAQANAAQFGFSDTRAPSCTRCADTVGAQSPRAA
ncbi:hypothetical protein PR003_g10368 [Phytophthora rubi]|uniref:Uncharacterized protein n=1 Tax=Phytophthora rubi TaxID=129364 RepID=A0A6A4FDX2_9STRA|nr:hypothetical protein PR003_g10368 [Phytophthora rubi]